MDLSQVLAAFEVRHEGKNALVWEMMDILFSVHQGQPIY